ncbi:MAG: pilus assembly protein TadG-related protein, partial [Acidimicrobiia bacterium]
MSVKELIRSEKGTVAIIVAASLLFMMGLAAIVVDGGQGFSERRQAQSGVDFASLAALQFASSCDTTCAIADAVDNGAAEAESVVAGNLPGRSLDWLACDDTATRPAEYIYVSSITDCISFTANLEKARVKLPDDQVGTSFGRVLGITSMTTGAVAEAIQKVESSASVIPLTLGGSSAEVCLYSNQAPQNVPPCDSPDNGNFGYLDIALYG